MYSHVGCHILKGNPQLQHSFTTAAELQQYTGDTVHLRTQHYSININAD